MPLEVNISIPIEHKQLTVRDLLKLCDDPKWTFVTIIRSGKWLCNDPVTAVPKTYFDEPVVSWRIYNGCLVIEIPEVL